MASKMQSDPYVMIFCVVMWRGDVGIRSRTCDSETGADVAIKESGSKIFVVKLVEKFCE